MCNVLIVDNDKIERYVTKDILKHHFNNVKDVFEAENNEEAYKLLDASVIDLLISNFSNTGLNLMSLVKFTKIKNPDVSVILTTTRSEKEVAHAAMKLKANSYLLKPFSPDLLLSTAKPYIEKEKIVDRDVPFTKIEEALKQLRAGIREHLYKKCIVYAKSYLNDIYNEEMDTNQRCDMVVGYLQGITKIAEEYSLDNIDIFKTVTKEVKLRFDKYGMRYHSYLLVTDMLTQMFDELDKDYHYSDEITKVLNYIDKNIKFGITLEEAANYINMSACYFSKRFKKVTKNNFITYITNSKIELAKEMLRYTEMPILNIAYELSYNETNYFSKAFKKNVGITPSEYRDKCLKAN
ncbi:helix-turn-helix domain-containing protein [Sinanaerobacter sp. ZZT-01]|uniref:helix-turn-helix domain-containing protein n=1 Tax=Sinanaerobacter sp. ZZT-01 TaxID=3111540 RepID=UPI002D77D0E1|nr:helix-turn-helix domain-containing protein [Sinanaerobacter sp. ZZT-01]WRR92621.1 helix-turn-helix domain-containing protein [Sinanaerobacter sp. ZZT-01]